MRCPKCKVLMQRIEYEDVPIRLCGECGGTWLSELSLKAIMHKRQQRLPEPVQQKFLDLADRSDSKEELACLSCGKIMTKQAFMDWDDIVIDRCAGCGGIWLDPGELEKIQIYWEYAQDHPELVNWSALERKALAEAQLAVRKAELRERAEVGRYLPGTWPVPAQGLPGGVTALLWWLLGL